MPPNDDETEWSKEGTLLHLHLAKPELDRSALTRSQVEILELAETLKKTAIRDIEKNGSIPESADSDEFRERALILRDGPRLIFPGTCDVLRVYPSADAIALLDAKFGYAEVTSAENNLQLAAYAVMAFDEIPMGSVYAAIFAPRAPFGERVTSAVYTAEQMPAIRAEIIRIVDASNAPDAPLNASVDACRNCRAKEACPAYREASIGQIVTVNLESMLALPAEEFGKIGDAIKLADMLKKHWSDEARRRIEVGEMPGWKLKDNGAVSKLEDIRAAYARFLEKYGDHYKDDQGFADSSLAAVAFMGCLEPRWGALDALFGKLLAVGDKKARKEINALFEGLITREEKAKSPVREK